MMKHLSKIAGAFALALLVAACSNPLNERAPAGADGAEGKVAITIGGGERTLVPAQAELAGFSYTLLIRQGDTVIHSGAVQPGTPFEKALPPGYYYISIHAANTAGAPVAFAEYTSVQVKAGETSRVNAVLKPVLDSDVAGTFTYTTVFPSAADYPDGYSQARLTLNPDSSNSGINSGSVSIDLQDTTKRTGSLTLPPGVYQLQIELTSTRQINNTPLKAVRLETVYIYPRLTTRADYTFTAADFKGDVFLKGTATVYRDYSYSPEPDSGYKPVEVEAELLWGPTGTTVGKAAIAQDGTWELFIPSHYLDANVTSVRLRFKMGKTSGEVLYSNWETNSLNNIQGNDNISLSTVITAVTFAPGAISSGTGTVRFNNADNVVVIGQPATVQILPTAGYGFIGNSLTINYSNVPINNIVSENGNITTVWTASSASPQVTGAQFFRLAGKVIFHDSTPSAGYAPVSIEARKIDTLTGTYVNIGTNANVSSTGTWIISVPAGYVFKDSLDDNVYFEVTLAKTGASNITFNDNNNFRRSVFSLTTTGVTSQYDDITIYASDLFTAQNVAATVTGSSSVRVTWDAPAASGVTGYQVYVYDSSSYPSAWTLLTPTAITALQYNHTGISSLSSVSYRVDAIISGTTHTGLQVSLRLQTPVITSTPSTTTTGLLQNSVYLQWNQVPLADYYYVEYNTDGSSWSYLYSGTNTYYNHSGIQPADTTYQYRVTAQSWSGSISNSQPSAVQTVSGPETESVSLYSQVNGNIETAGERKYYRVSNWTNCVRVFLYDSQIGNGTLDARLYIYDATNVNSYTYVDYYDTTFYAYYNDIIVVVEAADGSSTGSFSFYSEQY